MLLKIKNVMKLTFLSTIAVTIFSYATVQAQSSTDYLMICADTLYNTGTVNQYISWIGQRNNWTTKKVKTGDIGSTPEQIKNYISTEFTASNGELKYVVLVGSHTAIPVPVVSNAKSDLWYGCLDATNSLLPRVAIGRFPTNNISELEAMFWRTYYFYNRNESQQWTKNITFVSADTKNGEDYQNIQDFLFTGLSNGFASEEFPYDHLLARKKFSYSVINGSSADNAAITSMFNDGRSLVLFNGRGTTGNWSDWNNQNQSYGATEISGIANGNKTPIVLSSADFTGDITGSCMGEELVVHTLSSRAVAFAGPYENLNKNFNGSLNMMTLVASAMVDFKAPLGWAINYAVYHMARIYTSDPLVDHDMKVICCIGEPSLKLFDVNHHFVRTGAPGSTIQATIDIANDNDVVLVEPGHYILDGDKYENSIGDDSATIVIVKPLILKSLYGAENTIIDGNMQRMPFRVNQQFDKNVTIDGFTIQNGLNVCSQSCPNMRSGAIFVGSDQQGNPNLIVSNCAFVNNGTDWYGSAIYMHNGATLVYNCVMCKNNGGVGAIINRDIANGIAFNITYIINNQGTVDESFNNLKFDSSLIPNFVSYYKNDFHLRANSYAINASTNAIPAVLFDLAGNRRLIGSKADLGAYEYQGNQ